mgnify:CR=1 FL=1
MLGLNFPAASRKSCATCCSTPASRNVTSRSGPGSTSIRQRAVGSKTSLRAKARARGVDIAFVTLHVGAGTFKPVDSEIITDHPMHSEFFQISPEAKALVEAAIGAAQKGSE